MNEEFLKYKGETDIMYFDTDLWSYFVVLSVVKWLGYDGFKDLWFFVGCGFVLDYRLEPLFDDRGAMHMVNLARLNGKVHLYVVHTMSQSDVIHMIEYDVDEGREELAAMMHEGGDCAVLDERTKEDDGGVTEQLGQAIQKDHAEGVCGSQSLGDDDGEADRIEVHDGEGDGGITQELGDLRDLDDIQVEVHKWSTSDDDDNGEVNSMEDLVNINVECDLRESGRSCNMEVEVESVSLEMERSDWSVISELDLDDDDISDSNLFNDEWEFEDLITPDISDS
ncbi:hypothetical protein LR48_Vigan11g043300 [Vigna angularis]|uniref:PB1-like domain-containing protein n=1 Tax=Phaseolus angularis TaxID=3914 RepID=A0A0L9VQQ8_PHAAN|nr:hypothetical protein LR48_Vigan11g043300 [Vigna angularis]